MSMSTDRVKQLCQLFGPLKIDAFLVTFPPHLRYLSNFSGSSGIGLVTERSSILFTDGRYKEQARAEAKGWRVVVTSGSLFDGLSKSGSMKPGTRIGIDGNTVNLAQYHQLKKMLSMNKFAPKSGVIERIAAVKDEGEIDHIRRAVSITDRVFSDIVGMIAPGVTEIDLAAEITYRQRKYGADGDAFEPIVVSGERGALPHGKPSPKAIKAGEFLTLDFGCVYKGYHSDMTRTVAVGKPQGKIRKLYEIVLNAQRLAVDSAKAGMHTKDLDAVARDYIRMFGYEKHFQHSLGHGVGLQIHEAPRISTQSSASLVTGNVITIEPGIYLAGVGGIRIEDIVVIRNGACEVLTSSPKDLLVL